MNSMKVKKMIIYVTITILSTSQVDGWVFATGENTPIENTTTESTELIQENTLTTDQEIPSENEKTEEENRSNEANTPEENAEENVEDNTENNTEGSTDTEGNTDTEDQEEEKSEESNEMSSDNSESVPSEENTENLSQIVLPKTRLSALRSPSLLGANPTTPQTFTLSFDSNGGEEVSSVELPAGTQLSAYRPEDPYYAHHMLL